MNETWGRRLARGALSGAAGGVAAVTVLWFAVEPAIAKAIDLEKAGDGGHAHDGAGSGHTHGADGGEVVTRLQQQIGGTLTVIVVAAMMGVAFAVVYTRSRHRLPGTTDLGKSVALGALAFAVIGVLPALVVPANPPGVGDPETVNHRTLAYLLVIGLGLLVVGGVFALRRILDQRGVADEIAWLLTAVAAVAGVGAILGVAPGPSDAVPHTMPAGLLWDFRVGSLAQIGLMWGVLGLVNGVLAHRSLRVRTRPVVEPAAHT